MKTPEPMLAANIAAIGGNLGGRAADAIVANNHFDGTVNRISASTFNSLSVTDLKANYDVLLFTWNSSSAVNADWTTRIKPYLELGGDVIFEDDVNIADLSSVITVGPSAGTRSFVPVPGLTDGINPATVTPEHFRMSSWDSSVFSPFFMSGTSALGLYGEVGSNGGRIVVTGPTIAGNPDLIASFWTTCGVTDLRMRFPAFNTTLGAFRPGEVSHCPVVEILVRFQFLRRHNWHPKRHSQRTSILSMCW